MKVLKEGNPATAVISCPHCKCEMEYNNGDLYKESIYENYNCTSYPQKKIETFYIKCPCCKEHITVRKL